MYISHTCQLDKKLCEEDRTRKFLPIGFHKWPNNGHEIASHSTHYNLLACTHH